MRAGTQTTFRLQKVVVEVVALAEAIAVPAVQVALHVLRGAVTRQPRSIGAMRDLVTVGFVEQSDEAVIDGVLCAESARVDLRLPSSWVTQVAEAGVVLLGGFFVAEVLLCDRQGRPVSVVVLDSADVAVAGAGTHLMFREAGVRWRGAVATVAPWGLATTFLGLAVAGSSGLIG